MDSEFFAEELVGVIDIALVDLLQVDTAARYLTSNYLNFSLNPQFVSRSRLNN